jgi:hypothetical protein
VASTVKESVKVVRNLEPILRLRQQ